MFDNSDHALRWFCDQLEQRQFTINEVRTIKVNTTNGRFVNQKQIWTIEGEVFHLKYWTQKWVPLQDNKIYDFAKPWNDRLKYTIKTFGHGDISASGLNESTLIDLLEISNQGSFVHLVTIYSNGEVLWCNVRDLYDFATEFALIPEYSQNYGEAFCWIPTGWLKRMESLVEAVPAII